jgi:hypothetical protein
MLIGYLYRKQFIMYKNFNLTESEKEQILKQHQSHGYKKPLNEQSFEDYSSDMEQPGDEMKSPDSVNLQSRLLFIADNLDAGHTDDMNVTSESMVELLKEVIKQYVNPNETIPLKDWEKLYYSITNDSYA